MIKELLISQARKPNPQQTHWHSMFLQCLYLGAQVMMWTIKFLWIFLWLTVSRAISIERSVIDCRNHFPRNSAKDQQNWPYDCVSWSLFFWWNTGVVHRELIVWEVEYVFPQRDKGVGAKKPKRIFITCNWKLIIFSWITTPQEKPAKSLKTIHEAHWPVRIIMLKNIAILNLFDYTLFYRLPVVSSGSNAVPGFIFSQQILFLFSLPQI